MYRYSRGFLKRKEKASFAINNSTRPTYLPSPFLSLPHTQKRPQKLPQNSMNRSINPRFPFSLFSPLPPFLSLLRSTLMNIQKSQNKILPLRTFPPPLRRRRSHKFAPTSSLCLCPCLCSYLYLFPPSRHRTTTSR